MKRIFFVFCLVLAALFVANAQTGYSVNDLLNTVRVGDPQVSPDGRWVAYTVGNVDKAANKTLTQIHLMAIDGSGHKQLTDDKTSSSSPRWSPDGRHIAFTNGGQIWTMEADGDHKAQITKLSSGGGQPVWSHDGQWIAFSSDVYPECKRDECNKAEDEKAENSKVKAHVT